VSGKKVTRKAKTAIDTLTKESITKVLP